MTSYRVAQEALNNVARHAKSSLAEVTVLCLDCLIYMEIPDNEQGFNVDGTPDAKKSKRLGLLGMRERIEMIGGIFSFPLGLIPRSLLRLFFVS